VQPAALSQVRRQFQDLTFFQDTGDKGKGKGAMVGSYVTNLLRLCGKLNLAELMQIRANTFKWRETRAFEDYQDFVAQHFLPRGIKKCTAPSEKRRPRLKAESPELRRRASELKTGCSW
jgi:hypothetical protein